MISALTFVSWYTVQICWLIARSYNAFESLSTQLKWMTAPNSNIHQYRSQCIPQKVRESFSFIHQSKKVFKSQRSTEDIQEVLLTTGQSALMTQPQHTTDEIVKLFNMFLNSEERKNSFYNTTSQFRWTQAIKYRFSSQTLNTSVFGMLVWYSS